MEEQVDRVVSSLTPAGDFDNAAWPLLIFESGPTPMCFDRFKLRL